jgi:hypothetical protein
MLGLKPKESRIFSHPAVQGWGQVHNDPNLTFGLDQVLGVRTLLSRLGNVTPEYS